MRGDGRLGGGGEHRTLKGGGHRFDERVELGTVTDQRETRSEEVDGVTGDRGGNGRVGLRGATPARDLQTHYRYITCTAQPADFRVGKEHGVALRSTTA